MAEQPPTTGVIDPATGQPVPNSGPSGGPPGAAAGTVARDVATRGTAGTEDGPDPSSGASGAADQAKDKAQDAAGTAKEKAQDAAEQAQAKAQDAAGQAKNQLQTQLDQRSTQAGERATATAGDLRSISDHLRDQGNDAPARLADNAALQIEKVGSYLQRTDGGSLLDDLESFARRNPWAAALGGLAVGFAASRALKASSAERTVSRGTSQRSLPSPTPSPVGTGAPTPPPAAPAQGTPTPTGTPGVVPPTGDAIADAPEVTGYSVPHGAPGQPGTGAA
jgi:uncharacterized protein YjbJ (UPF0337 family)